MSMPGSLESGLMLSLDARGHYTVGKELVDSVIDRIRRVAGWEPIISSPGKFGFGIPANEVQTTVLLCKGS
jgi:hypothetical protein